MGSRRMMTRSVSANGRSINGDDVSGSSRTGGCSYLSNVRPENRSTLCSVIAQLTEETQPSFETTLKSKAVSEKCSVKFSCVVTGYPTPQVTWYKDDMQLDRYCGLPKYEIFRNGQSHSLHIYNCTVEDAAIYQASASNTKGIVSCSGVLEVGEMNEFKIHQRYFGKIKQKAEQRSREAEGKENLEPLRTLSPERTQRKRRSTAEAFLSPPSSTEDEGTDENHQAAETETRLQEAGAGEVEEKPAVVTDGTVCAINNGRDVRPQMHDAAHQAKTPSVKKIKISNSAKSAKADTLGERTKEEIPTSGALSCSKSDEVMEVEDTVVNSYIRNMRKHQKSATKEEKLSAVPAVAPAAESGSDSKHGKKGGRKDRPQSPAQPIALKGDISKSERGESSSRRNLEPVDMLHNLNQSPWEQAGNLLFEEGTRQKHESGSGPDLQSEAQTMSNRNEAPVSLQLPQDQFTLDEQPPQKTQVESETTTDDTQTLSLDTGLQVPLDKMTGDTLHHSRGSDESHMVLFTDPQKSPLESSGAGEKTQGCKVSLTALQSQVDTAIKSVDGMEIQVDEKVESNVEGKLLVQDDDTLPNERIVVMETENVALEIVEQIEEQETPVLKTLKEGDSDMCEPAATDSGTNPDNTHSLQHMIDFREIPKPVSKVLSIAELLRAQLKALDSTLANSAPAQTEFVPAPATTGTETHEEVRDRHSTRNEEVKTSVPNRKMDKTPTSMKATLNTDSRTECGASSPVQALQNRLVIPPISVTTTETAECHVGAKTFNNGIMNIGQETKASSQVPLTDQPVVSLTTSEDIKPISHPPVKASSQETKTPALECGKKETVHEKDVGLTQKVTPDIKLNSKTESRVSDTGLDQCNTSSSSLPSVKSPTGPQENQRLQQDGSSAEEVSTDLTPEASPPLKESPCVSPIPSATPQELASGARRKILLPKPQHEETTEATSPVDDQSHKKEVSTPSSKLSTSPVTLSTSPGPSPGLSRRSALLQPAAEPISPVERRSPLSARRQQPAEDTVTSKTEEKPAEKNKQNPFKAPQVIRKIRSETFADASGHLKLWCQFFNVLSDSTIKWHKNDTEVVTVRRNAGDETQVSLAIVQASSKDSGVYRCSIINEYGTDSTDLLLSAEILAGLSLREDLGVGEEIEMTPLIFSKGVADSGVWGNKLFGRIMMQESRIGDGCSHKVWRAKVIYGLEPVFESGNTCIIKVHNPIAYGGKGESCLIEKNLETVKQECKIQNLAREYCKIFSAEARAIENFGTCLEVVPVHLMYRPANTVPYATVEADVTGVYQKYSVLDSTGRLEVRSGSGVEQKCCALQHWIFQWTNGNLLLTRLEGVDTKITNVGISVKSTGHQGLSVEGTPKVFEHFVSQHQCNYFCGLLGLRSLKVMDSLSAPGKAKGSRSPLLQRKMAAGSSSPQTGRKAAGSPRQGRKTPTKQKASEAPQKERED